jgi:integrase/recombinase XerD
MAKRKQGEISPNYILWVYSTNSEGKHPVKIRIIHQRTTKYYSVKDEKSKKIFLNQKEYDYITETKMEKLRGDNRDIRKTLERAVSDAEDAVKEATNKGKKPFSWGEFERKYLGADASKSFMAFFANHIAKLAKKGQAGTVRAYQSAYSALYEFSKGKDFDPADLTIQKLEAFDEWLRTPRPKKSTTNKKATTKSLNDTSVSIYLRCIRSVYNEMAELDDYLKVVYPFSQRESDKRYKIPSGSGGQKGVTLSKDEIDTFIAGAVDGAEIPENPMYRAKQLFLFSLFAQGVNFKDMALLKFGNIDKDTIVFERQKTIRTKRQPVTIRIPLTEPLNDILIEQSSTNKGKNNFVFEVFDANKAFTPKQIDDNIRQWVKTTNKWLRRYCEFNDIPVVSTYSARHTFASLAKGLIPVVQISKMLGHSKITTTQAYLGRFEDDENRASLETVYGSINKSKRA